MPGRLDKLVMNAQRMNLCTSDFLEQLSSGTRDHAFLGGVSHALFSSHPVTNTVRVPWVHRLILCVSVPWACVAVFQATRPQSIAPYRHYRFTNLERRDGSAPPDSPGIAEFGLMRHGEMEGRGVTREGEELPCIAADAVGVLGAEGASMSLSLASKPETSYSMWYIRTMGEEGTQGKDAVRFVLEGSDDEEEWETVGSSTFEHYFGTVVLTKGVAGVPEGRGRVFVIDSFTMSMLHWLHFNVLTVVFRVGIVAVAILGIKGMNKWTMRGICWNAGSQGVVRICMGVLMLIQDRESDMNGVYAIGMGVAWGLLSFLWTFYEETLEVPTFIYAIFQIVLQGCVTLHVHGTWVVLYPIPFDLLESIAWFGIGTLIISIRISLVQSTMRGIAEGKAAYLTEWSQISVEEREDIDKLQHTVKRMRMLFKNAKARQLNPLSRTSAHVHSQRRGSCASSQTRHVLRGTRQVSLRITIKKAAYSSMMRFPPSPSRIAPSSGSPKHFSIAGAVRRYSRKGSVATTLGVVQESTSYLSENLLQSRKLGEALMKTQDSKRGKEHLGKPIESLDQLHTQAYLVHDIFSDFVVKVAGTHNGKFPMWSDDPNGTTEFDSWDGDDATRKNYKLGGMKSVSSAFSKLDVAYNGDVSRLLDMCRETIYFETVADIHACLMSISQEPTVDIVRVKSTMQPIGEGSNYGARAPLWAGMPLVKINVRMAGSDEARNLCVDMHVCELVLTLVDFGRIQTQDLWLAYRKWRRCKRIMAVFWRLAQKLKKKDTLPEEHLGRALSSDSGGTVGSRGTRDSHGTGRHRDTPSRQSGHGEGTKPDIQMATLNPRRMSRVLEPTPEMVVVDGADAVKDSEVSNSQDSECSNSKTKDSIVPNGAERRSSTPSVSTWERCVPEAPSQQRSRASLSALNGSEFFSASSPRAWAFRRDEARPGSSSSSPVCISNRRSMDLGNSFLGNSSKWEGGVTSWGMPISGDMEELLLGLSRLSAMGIEGFLDRQWKSVARGDTNHGFQSSSLSGLFYAKHPITAAASRWPIKLFLFLMAAYCTAVGVASTTLFSERTKNYAFGPFVHYRLETMLTRNNSVGKGVTGPGVSDFGLIGLSGCSKSGTFPPEDGQVAEPVPSFKAPVGSSYLLTYPNEGRSMTGWYIHTGAAEGSQALDPAYFNVWASNEELDLGDGSCARGRDDDRWWMGRDSTEWCGVEWRRVGGTHWRFRGVPYADQETKWWDFVQIPISLPESRNSLETFLLQPAWKMYFWFWTLTYLVAAPFLLLACVNRHASVYFQKMPAPHNLVSFGAFMACACGWIAAAVSGLLGAPHLMIEMVIGASSNCFLCLACSAHGKFFQYGVWLYSMFSLVGWIAMSQMYFHAPFATVSNLGIVGLFVSAIITGLRVHSLWSSKKMLIQDQVRYDELWKTLSEAEDSAECIAHLETVVRMIGLDETNHCRQHNRLRADKLVPALRGQYIRQNWANPAIHPLFWDVGHWYVPGRQDPKSLVSSLNQLYNQAALANLLVLERIKVWAEASSGMVRLKPAEGIPEDGILEDQQNFFFVKWSDAKQDPSMLGRVQWTAMKRHSRAIEKLLRSYGNAPSRLCDLSRNCLIFDNLVDLTNCLGIIVTDEHVRVERLKNRMRHKADETAGYRDVCINLMVTGKEAQHLGCDQHMCEVQLLIKDFALLKSVEGHTRYVKARNTIGN